MRRQSPFVDPSRPAERPRYEEPRGARPRPPLGAAGHACQNGGACRCGGRCKGGGSSGGACGGGRDRRDNRGSPGPGPRAERSSAGDAMQDGPRASQLFAKAMAVRDGGVRADVRRQSVRPGGGQPGWTPLSVAPPALGSLAEQLGRLELRDLARGVRSSMAFDPDSVGAVGSPHITPGRLRDASQYLPGRDGSPPAPGAGELVMGAPGLISEHAEHCWCSFVIAETARLLLGVAVFSANPATRAFFRATLAWLEGERAAAAGSGTHEDLRRLCDEAREIHRMLGVPLLGDPASLYADCVNDAACGPGLICAKGTRFCVRGCQARSDCPGGNGLTMGCNDGRCEPVGFPEDFRTVSWSGRICPELLPPFGTSPPGQDTGTGAGEEISATGMVPPPPPPPPDPNNPLGHKCPSPLEP